MAPKAGKSATNLEAQTQRLRGLASVLGINLDDLDSDNKSHAASAHKSPKKAKKARANSNQTETTGYTSLKRRTYTICSPDVSSDALSSHPECSHAAPINNGSFNQSNHTADTNAQTASALTTPTNEASAKVQSAPFNSTDQIVGEGVKLAVQACLDFLSGSRLGGTNTIARQSDAESSHAAPINNGSLHQSNHTADNNAQTASAYTTNDATAPKQSPLFDLGQAVAALAKNLSAITSLLFGNHNAIARQIVDSCFPYDRFGLVINELNLVSSTIDCTEYSAVISIIGHKYDQLIRCDNVLFNDVRIIEYADRDVCLISFEVVVVGPDLQNLLDGYEALQAAPAQEREAIINGMSKRFSKLFRSTSTVLSFTVENGFLARFELQNIDPKTS